MCCCCCFHFHLCFGPICHGGVPFVACADVQFGLAKGSSDLIGFKTIKVTPEMIGQDLAVFTSIEVKTNSGQLSKYQHNWLQAVKKAGGIVGVARNVKDALNILKVS